MTILFFYYTPVITDADHLAFGAGGDGYKNYYTLAYFLKYDSGSHFSGMNYPYGENVIFTDNQPAVAWILKCFVHLFPSLVNHIHAYIIWAFFISILLSAFVIYNILIDLQVGSIAAIIFATCIAMMAPQLPRLNAHFSLGYSCYIPLLLWLLIRYFITGGRIIYAALLCILITFFTFIHIYFLAMSICFIIPVVFIFWVVNFNEKRTYFWFIPTLFISVLLPFLVLKVYLLLSDPITDRPQNPWGYTEYYSTWSDIFLHPYSFTGQVMAQLMPSRLLFHNEGTGYIGVVTIVILILAVIIFFANLRSAKKLLIDLYPLNYFILPAIAVLLFAMAIPFGLPSFKGLYNSLPMAIKQLRAPGRFNWIFYYVATITACVIAYRIFLNLENRRKFLGYIFLLPLFSVWLIEVNMLAVRYEGEFRGNASRLDENADANRFFLHLRDAGKSASQFQAIMTFPFFLNGSEKLYLESGSAFEAMETSLFTGLPIAHGTMSRTSLSQTLKISNLITCELIHKSVIADYKSAKPLLLVAVGETFSPSEKMLIDKAKLLFHCDSKGYYELPLSAFHDTIARAKEYILSKQALFSKHEGYESNDSTPNVVLKRFEDEPKPYAVFGKGALYNRKDNVILFGGILPNGKDSTRYEISTWLYADSRVASFPDIYYSQSGADGREIESDIVHGSHATANYNNWLRVDLVFTLYHAKNTIWITGHGAFATFDEFMIRPIDEDVIIDLDKNSFYSLNNYPLP